MLEDNSKLAAEFDIKIRIRAKRGTGKDLAEVLAFLEARALSDGVKFNYKAELQDYLVNRYLVLALKAKGADKETLMPYAHQATAVFQGYIRAIEDAAGIQAGANRRDTVIVDSGQPDAPPIQKSSEAQAAAKADAEAAKADAEGRKRMDEVSSVFGA